MSPLDNLRQDYQSGKFKDIEADMAQFIQRNKNEIMKFKDTHLVRLTDTAPTDELAIKLFLMKTRSLNTIHELKLELDEIEKEIWYQGEKTQGAVDRNQVAQQWSKQYAAGWRDHFTTVTLYAFEQNKNKYLEILRDPP